MHVSLLLVACEGLVVKGEEMYAVLVNVMNVRMYVEWFSFILINFNEASVRGRIAANDLLVRAPHVDLPRDVPLHLPSRSAVPWDPHGTPFSVCAPCDGLRRSVVQGSVVVVCDCAFCGIVHGCVVGCLAKGWAPSPPPVLPTVYTVVWRG